MSVTLRPLFTPGKDPVPIAQGAGGPQGRSGQVRKISPPTGIRSSDRPARSSVAIPTELPGPHNITNLIGPPSYMLSVVDRNVVMRRISVYVLIQERSAKTRKAPRSDYESPWFSSVTAHVSKRGF